jgi:hypothetical protein
VDATGNGFVAYPCQPRLNVWGDSAAALLGSIAALPVHGDAYQKHSLSVLDAGCCFHSMSVPIEVVYLLTERGASLQPVMSDLPPPEALMALVRHSYGGCFLDGDMRAHEFAVFSRLVEQVPVRELTLADDLGTLVTSCQELAGRPYTR